MRTEAPSSSSSTSPPPASPIRFRSDRGMTRRPALSMVVLMACTLPRAWASTATFGARLDLDALVRSSGWMSPSSERSSGGGPAPPPDGLNPPGKRSRICGVTPSDAGLPLHPSPLLCGSALRQDREATAGQRTQDVEVAVVKGDDRLRPVARGEDDVRGVRDADPLVRVTLDDRASVPELLGVDRRQVPGAAGQLSQDRQLSCDAQPRYDQVVELGDDVRPNDQPLRGVVENGCYGLAVGLVRVEVREQGARVDDHRSPNPVRWSSAWRAIGAPLANRSPWGRGRSSPTALLIESLMTAASDSPRRRATRLIADLSSGGR